MISVIVPVYNMEKYVSICLESILNQTYNDIEVIIVDDGSTDNSASIIKEFDDDRIRYFKQTNQGVSQARNLGMHEAKGEWICFVDPDDWLKPNMLETLINNKSSNVDIIACCCEGVDGTRKYLSQFFEYDFVAENSADKKKLFLQLFNGQYGQSQPAITAIGVPWAKLYRKAMIDEGGLLFELGLKRQQDNIFNMYAFYMARSIVYINKELYCYRMGNIKKFYKSRYYPYAIDNFNIFQRCRQDFVFDNSKVLDDDIVIEYYNESISQIFNVLNSQVLNIYKKDKNQLYALKKFVEQENVQWIIRTMPFNKIRNKLHRLVAKLILDKRYFLIVCIWRARFFYDKTFWYINNRKKSK